MEKWRRGEKRHHLLTKSQSCRGCVPLVCDLHKRFFLCSEAGRPGEGCSSQPLDKASYGEATESTLVYLTRANLPSLQP